MRFFTNLIDRGQFRPFLPNCDLDTLKCATNRGLGEDIWKILSGQDLSFIQWKYLKIFRNGKYLMHKIYLGDSPPRHLSLIVTIEIPTKCIFTF